MGKLDLAKRQAVDPPPDHRDRKRSQVESNDLLVTIVGANTVMFVVLESLCQIISCVKV